VIGESWDVFINKFLLKNTFNDIMCENSRVHDPLLPTPMPKRGIPPLVRGIEFCLRDETDPGVWNSDFWENSE